MYTNDFGFIGSSQSVRAHTIFCEALVRYFYYYVDFGSLKTGTIGSTQSVHAHTIFSEALVRYFYHYGDLGSSKRGTDVQRHAFTRTKYSYHYFVKIL